MAWEKGGGKPWWRRMASKNFGLLLLLPVSCANSPCTYLSPCEYSWPVEEGCKVVEGGVDLFWVSWGSGKYPKKRSRKKVSRNVLGGGLCPLLCIGCGGKHGGQLMVAMKTDGRRPDFKRARRRPAAGSSCLISMIPEYASLMMFKVHRLCIIMHRLVDRFQPCWLLPTFCWSNLCLLRPSFPTAYFVLPFV